MIQIQKCGTSTDIGISVHASTSGELNSLQPIPSQCYPLPTTTTQQQVSLTMTSNVSSPNATQSLASRTAFQTQSSLYACQSSPSTSTIAKNSPTCSSLNVEGILLHVVGDYYVPCN